MGRHPRRRIARAGALREPARRIAPLDALHDLSGSHLRIDHLRGRERRRQGRRDLLRQQQGAVGDVRSRRIRPARGRSTRSPKPGPWGASIHGIGAGDINGDGRVDLIAPHGWWEQPAGGATVTPWTFHQGAFGRNGNAGGQHGGLRRQRRQTPRRRHLARRARLRPRLVRAEARRGRNDLIRRAHDHGGLRREESRRRDVHRAARA